MLGRSDHNDFQVGWVGTGNFGPYRTRRMKLWFGPSLQKKVRPGSGTRLGFDPGKGPCRDLSCRQQLQYNVHLFISFILTGGGSSVTQQEKHCIHISLILLKCWGRGCLPLASANGRSFPAYSFDL